MSAPACNNGGPSALTIRILIGSTLITGLPCQSNHGTQSFLRSLLRSPRENRSPKYGFSLGRQIQCSSAFSNSELTRSLNVTGVQRVRDERLFFFALSSGAY